jgi:hypothetical protein
VVKDRARRVRLPGGEEQGDKEGLYKLHPELTHSLKAPGLQPLKLKCDLLISNFACKCNLYCYNKVRDDAWRVRCRSGCGSGCAWRRRGR